MSPPPSEDAQEAPIPPERGGTPVPSPFACLALTLGAWLVARLTLDLVAPGAGVAPGLAAGLTLGLGVLGTLAARKVPEPAERRLGLAAPEPRDFAWLILLLPLPLLLSELDNLVVAWLGRPESDPAEPGRDPLDTLTWGLVLVGLRPVLEEFFFRGVLLQGLVSGVGRWRGLLLDAWLFALYRAAFFGSAYAAASLGGQALVEGALLAALRLATGSLLPGMVLHGTLAALGLAAARWSGAPAVAGFNAPGAHTPPEILLPALLVVGLGSAGILRAVRRAPPLPPIARRVARDDG